MHTLENYDLGFCVLRLPRDLVTIMKTAEWQGKIFVGGGYIRSVLSQDSINDIDVFVGSKTEAELLAHKLCNNKKHIHETENAFTITNAKPSIQIIHKWVFNKAEDVLKSFDFTICSAVIWHSSNIWKSQIDATYYADIATKRLIYKYPVRIEEAGGSTLRVLKYYQKGYRIPIDSFAGVLARLMSGVDLEKVVKLPKELREAEMRRHITALLRTVDPMVDPLHEAHLPKYDQDAAD